MSPPGSEDLQFLYMAIRFDTIPAMVVLETDRLTLRHLAVEDSAFFLELVNEPSWIRNIGDRGVRTPDDARRYIQDKYIESYRRQGFGLYLVELTDTQVPVGMCGLVKRDILADVDIGFAFLPRFWSKGYALESASAVLTYARDTLRLKRILGITVPDNLGSIRVLEKLGLRPEGKIKLSEDRESLLYALDLTTS